MKSTRRLWAFLAIVTPALYSISCSALRLELRLSPPIKEWYRQYWPLMEGAVPVKIDPRARKEREYFLRLPAELQERYLNLFWSLRDEETKKIYEERLGIVNRLYKEAALPGCLTDRGKVYLICGPPDSIEGLDESQVFNPLGNSIEGWTALHWVYQRGAMLYDVYFIWKSGRWHLDFYSVTGVENFRKLWEACLKEFSAREDGWNVWAGELRAHQPALRFY